MIEVLDECECSLCQYERPCAVLNDGSEWLTVCADCLQAALDALGEAA